MVYRVIGLMSGSSLDGLDIAFAEISENGGKWTYEIVCADCYEYPDEWISKLKSATYLNALDYQLLHTSYGHYLGNEVNRFILANGLQYKVALVASHGHTTFHVPAEKMTAQLGDGAAIAAVTQLPVASDLRSLDVALGGQGAPIVPIGEKLLLGDYDFFLNLGGIANLSVNATNYSAFDVCAANRVLNMLAARAGKDFDEGGKMSSGGDVNPALLNKLNELEYYRQPYPKSLANEFGTAIVYPIVDEAALPVNDALRTYAEHIAIQVSQSVQQLLSQTREKEACKMLVTGGGAFNVFLMERIRQNLAPLKVEVVIPDDKLVKFKEALIMGLIGVLRWREEANVLSSVTGSRHNSIGGALWMGLTE